MLRRIQFSIFLLSVYSCCAADKQTKPSVPQLVSEVYVFESGKLLEARMFHQDGKKLIKVRSNTEHYYSQEKLSLCSE